MWRGWRHARAALSSRDQLLSAISRHPIAFEIQLRSPAALLRAWRHHPQSYYAPDGRRVRSRYIIKFYCGQN